MKESKNVKELIFYAIIVAILLIVIIINNIYWKIGKENTINNQETHLLEINNITYNVPYEERWLD